MFVEFSYECPAMTQAKPYTNVVTFLQSWRTLFSTPLHVLFHFSFVWLLSNKAESCKQQALSKENAWMT